MPRVLTDSKVLWIIGTQDRSPGAPARDATIPALFGLHGINNCAGDQIGH
jgi:hypothetical protein